MSNSLGIHGLQHARLPCPPLSPRVCSNSYPLSQWCYLTVSPSAVLFPFCLQYFPAIGSFPMSKLFASGSQSIGVSASVSLLPMNIQDWFPLGLTDWISLLSKGLSRVFSNTTIQKHQFFAAQLYLWSKSHIHTWLLENQQGHSKWTGHGREFWWNVVHQRRKWQTTSVFLPWELHEQYEKAKSQYILHNHLQNENIRYKSTIICIRAI